MYVYSVPNSFSDYIRQHRINSLLIILILKTVMIITAVHPNLHHGSIHRAILKPGNPASITLNGGDVLCFREAFLQG